MSDEGEQRLEAGRFELLNAYIISNAQRLLRHPECVRAALAVSVLRVMFDTHMSLSSLSTSRPVTVLMFYIGVVMPGVIVFFHLTEAGGKPK